MYLDLANATYIMSSYLFCKDKLNQLTLIAPKFVASKLFCDSNSRAVDI